MPGPQSNKGRSMTKVKSQVRAFIADNFLMGPSADKFGDADSFLDLHIIDSTGFLELVTFLEEKFAITVEDEEMIPENLDSLDSIEAYVEKKLGNA
jgi:acyl carrier protein